MDFSRLRQGEIVAAIGGLALFLFMFFDWFGGGAASLEVTEEGVAVEGGGLSAWDSLQDFDGFLIALAAVSGVALGALAAGGRRVNLGGLPRGLVTAALGSLAVALILWRLLANPGDLEVGIFLGLAAAIAIAAGAVMALREDGFEPLLPVAGTTTATTTARAEPPAAARSTGKRSTTRRAGAASGRSRSAGAKKSGARSRTRKSSTTRSRSRASSSRAPSRSSGTRGRSSSRRASGSNRRSSGGTRRSSGGRGGSTGGKK